MSFICRNIEKLTGYVPGEQPHFEGMIKLNTNENPYPPSPAVGEALSAFDYKNLRLYPDPVFCEVRKQIAKINNCEIDQVFVGNGSDEVLSIITRAFLEVDGTVGYLNPTYSLYPVLAEIRDAQGKPFDLNADFSWKRPPADWSDLFLLTNPNAPTGRMAAIDEIRRFCDEFLGVVIIDEAYADFAPENCMSFAVSPENRNTLVMRTLSKSYSLAGVRFGYVVGPKPLISAMYKVKDSYNMDALAQIIGLAALRDQSYMKSNVAKIIATRERVIATLRARGWTIPDSAANFIFAKPPRSSAKAVFEALRSQHIFVRYFPAPPTEDYLRITIGSDSEIDRLLAIIQD